MQNIRPTPVNVQVGSVVVAPAGWDWFEVTRALQNVHVADANDIYCACVHNCG